MSRRSRSSDTLTGDMFAVPRAAAQLPGSMDYRTTVTHLVGTMLAKAAAAGLDRYEVAARASRLTGKDISKAMLDGYTAESREEFNCPMWLAPVLEAVCSCTDLAEWHGQVRGGRLLLGADSLDAEIGRLERERALASDQIKQLKTLSRKVR